MCQSRARSVAVSVESIPTRASSRGMAGLAVLAGVAVMVAALFGGCGSSSPTGGGGAVKGDLDVHCSGVTPVVLNPASCMPAANGPADPGTLEPAAPLLYNDEGDDDDCKYHVKFSVAPAVSNGGSVTFTLTLTKKSDGTPATGAIDSNGDGIAIEAYLASDETHVLPNPVPVAAEPTPGSGVYTMTGAKFDASGSWVVRFHLFEGCSDTLADSPHGHVAFHFDVP